MSEYLSPGVYVEEFESGSKPIEGISTSTAGFVGMAERGPVSGAPVLVTSFADYYRKFGSYLSEEDYAEYKYLPLCVEQFFNNGGARAFIMRVVPSDAKEAVAKQQGVTLQAADAGAWGNHIGVTVTPASRARIQLIEKLDAKVYKAKNINGLAAGDIVKFQETYNVVEKVTENVITFQAEFAQSPVDTGLVAKNFIYTDEVSISIQFEDIRESYENVSINPASAYYIEKAMEKSDLIRVRFTGAKAAESTVKILFGEAKDKVFVTLEGGSSGDVSKVDASVFAGADSGPGKRTGIKAFLENDLVNIMAVPGITDSQVVMELITHCENLKSRFAVLDVPKEKSKTSEVLEYRQIVDSSYAAMYHPWIQVFDPKEGKQVFIPPSGAVMGVYARSDISRGVQKAPANETVRCTGLSTYYNKGEQDVLNPAGVNLIRKIPGQGIRVWGARTTSSDTSFRYVNVRRLFIFVEESIKAATSWVVFEPNSEALWGRVRRSIESFLLTLWRGGALAGSSPNEAFFVDVSRNTMTQDDINNGRLICTIGIAPSRPAEFVIFRITQITETGKAE